MRPLDRLEPSDLAEVLRTYHRGLLTHREAINRLNVYPVPDEDTGTNLTLTMESVVAHLGDAGDLEGVCEGMARGSLMGARGASGVILSQLLRTLAGRLRSAGVVDARSLAGGLVAAADDAAGAVLTPVEGTILTVAREGAAAAARAGAGGGDLAGVLREARAAAADTLARTPEMLDVLARAGVVDAGGTGFVLLLDAFLQVVAGVPLPAPSGTDRAVRPEPAAGEKRFELVVHLEAPPERVETLREAWARLGNDSTAVVGGDGAWVCHVHTNELERALETARAAGTPTAVRVIDLLEQVELLRQAIERAAVATGLVTAVEGPGLRKLFRARGAVVVHGGRSLNPSTELLLTAVETAGAPSVILLPNDQNVAAVADQVPAFAGVEVAVVPTRSIPQGLAALAVYRPDDPPEANRLEMNRAASAVRSGEVTQASRDARTAEGPVRKGDWLGFAEGRLVAVGSTPGEALAAVVASLVEPATASVVIVAGEGAEPAVIERAVAQAAAVHPGMAVEVVDGGQPVYPYLVGAGTRPPRA